MRTILVAFVIALAGLSGCAKAQPLDVISAPAVCDSVPPPLAPGERIGGELPPGVAATVDAGAVVGVVQEARSGRPLQAATVRLDSVGSRLPSVPLGHALSDAAGGFTLRAVRPGTYTLRTMLIAHVPRERAITVRAGAIDTVSMELAYLHCMGY
jgi:hypothetical protein